MLTWNRKFKQLGFTIELKDNYITISKFVIGSHAIIINLQLKHETFAEKFIYDSVRFNNKLSPNYPTVFSYSCSSSNKKDLLDYLRKLILL